MAATINSVFTLASSSGSDPLSIRIAPTFAIGDPTGSGSITTTTATNDSVVSSSATKDTYVFVRNTGASSAGNVLVTDGGAPANIALLKPQDFLFIPVKAGAGLRINYDTAATTLDWFYWTRG
jgi:hypothetical protein|tara:strand:- start:2662 stop:3030 length:369 start_codon:yes stop_codon:yes gene_type:complete